MAFFKPASVEELARRGIGVKPEPVVEPKAEAPKPVKTPKGKAKE